MKVLYIDCSMGAAGDMLTASLASAAGDISSVQKELNEIGIPGVEYIVENTKKMGVTGTSVRVLVNGAEEETEDVHEDHHDHEHGHHHEHEHHHDHEHEHEHHHHDHDHGNDEHDHHHDHEHEHHHHHASMADIENIINGLSVSEKVKNDAVNVYKIIAEAESKVHGESVSEIHFHEVGAMDAVADITACCYLADKIGADKIIVSPVRTGKGHVHCAHGILPVPAPATAKILMDVPNYQGDIDGEMCTPTGAALIKYFADGFGSQPVMTTEAMGYGMGKKDFPQLNVLRTVIGEEKGGMDEITELTVILDDMTPERIGFACDRFFELGAVEVYTTPVNMKKFRPGVLLTVLCREEKRDAMVEAVFKYTTTLGIRENISRRYALKREVVTVDSPFGEIRKKQSSGYGVRREKYEYDDLASIAHGEGVSIEEVIDAITKNKDTHIETEEEDFDDRT